MYMRSDMYTVGEVAARDRDMKDTICKGFLAQNRHLMENARFKYQNHVVYGDSERSLSARMIHRCKTIDALFVASRDFSLAEIMPDGSLIREPHFHVSAGTHVQFAITTNGDNRLSSSTSDYLQREVEKHRDFARCHGTQPGAPPVLILIHGIDHATLHPRFIKLCHQNRVVGTTVCVPLLIAFGWAGIVRSKQLQAEHKAQMLAMMISMAQHLKALDMPVLLPAEVGITAEELHEVEAVVGVECGIAPDGTTMDDLLQHYKSLKNLK